METGRSVHADYKLIAKALTRKGTALMKMAKSSKDYDAAIEVFNKALTEHRNPDTLKKLNDAERIKKELEQQEYYDPAVADAEREKGVSYYTFVFAESTVFRLVNSTKGKQLVRVSSLHFRVRVVSPVMSEADY